MSGSTKLVTSDEALNFVERVLGMSSPSTRIKTNPLNFVGDLARAWLHHIPYQSIKGIATPHHLRHLPTVAEMKQDVMTDKIGGLCYQNNVLVFLILQALGFDASLLACDFKASNDHMAVLIHNLTREGSKHYIDMGMGNPLLRAVPFDFADESPVYHDSFLRYKFSRQGDVIHFLLQVEGHPVSFAKKFLTADRITDGWFQCLVMHIGKEVEISHFTPSMRPIYTKVGASPFLSSVRCMAWPNGRFVCIKDTSLLLENEVGCISKTYLRSRDEIKDAYAQYFPQISEVILDEALDDNNVKLDYTKGLDYKRENCQ